MSFIIMNVGQTRSFVEIEIDQNLWTIDYGLISSVHRFVWCTIGAMIYYRSNKTNSLNIGFSFIKCTEVDQCKSL